MLPKQQEKELREIMITASCAAQASLALTSQVMLEGLTFFCKKHHWYDMQFLNNLLRSMNSPIFLIALSKEYQLPQTTPKRLDNEEQTEFALHIYTGSKEGFIQELRKSNSTPTENIHRLADCGFPQIDQGTQLATMAKKITKK